MSADQMGNTGPSRRDFLSAAAMAAVAGTVCGAGGVDDKKAEMASEKVFLAEAEARQKQPIITWEEGVAATNAFYEQYLLSFPANRLLGVALLTWDEGPKEKFIEVRYKGEPPQVPIHFSYHSPNEADPDKLERVRVRTSPRAGSLPSLVKSGDPAKGESVPIGGSVGWNIRYNGMNICIGAAHALCNKFNLTPIDTPVYLAGANIANARLRSWQRIDWNLNIFNLWDLAMAEYNKPNYMEAALRQCTNLWDYPQRLSVNPTAKFSYKKVGAGSPVCHRGYLNGIGKSSTLFRNGKTAYFDGQFLLSSMSTDGDSGALLIWEDTPNTAAGIIYSGDGGETVACPLFRAPIQLVGDFALAPGITIPEYMSLVQPTTDLGTSCW